MKTTIFSLVAFLATAALAVPTDYPTTGGGDGGNGGGDGGDGSYVACPSGLYSSPQCCATDVLGVADLDCHSPSSSFTSSSSFQSVCAAGGQRARCCVIPVLGQSVLCQTPTGLGEA
ncbi:hydrophobin [Biscogniauxia mediterranea]|nr:hydrophobin [Biscogniauxia mediterranea]